MVNPPREYRCNISWLIYTGTQFIFKSEVLFSSYSRAHVVDRGTLMTYSPKDSYLTLCMVPLFGCEVRSSVLPKCDSIQEIPFPLGTECSLSCVTQELEVIFSCETLVPPKS